MMLPPPEFTPYNWIGFEKSPLAAPSQTHVTDNLL